MADSTSRSPEPAASIVLMSTPPAIILLDRLAALRVDLVDLAYDLDVRGNRAAADVAMSIAARLAELCEEFSDTSGGAGPQPGSDSLSKTSPCTR